jgi:hypothetical protein
MQEKTNFYAGVDLQLGRGRRPTKAAARQNVKRDSHTTSLSNIESGFGTQRITLEQSEERRRRQNKTPQMNTHTVKLWIDGGDGKNATIAALSVSLSLSPSDRGK